MMAMLMPGNAAARDNKARPSGRDRKPRTEMRLAHNRPVVAHRPSMGARFDRRPVHGRFININRERLWLADGILYRAMNTPRGIVYVVVGYYR